MYPELGPFGEGQVLPPVYGIKPDFRVHHYAFAHFIMPKRLWQNPEWFLEQLHSEQSRGFLITRWLEASIPVEDDEFIPPDETLKYEAFEINGGYRADVISLPKPLKMTEAYMVAIVSRPARRRFLLFKTPAVLRYFTLEFSYHDDMRTPRTYFCEWTPQKHLNYETGPNPDTNSFLEAIEAKLAES